MLSALVDAAMVVLPPSGFVAQWRKMLQARSSEGFSTLVPAVLIACNVLRLGFWLGKRFSAVLVAQSLVMLAVQLALLHSAVRLRRRPEKPPPPLPRTLAGYFSAFWDWPTFAPYAATTVAFAALVLLLAGATAAVPAVVELFGVAALAVEALLGVPQVVRNSRLRSTAGLSVLLVLTWFAGDAFKSWYFAAHGSPPQFLLCGLFQLAVDVVLLVQFAVLPNTNGPLSPLAV